MPATVTFLGHAGFLLSDGTHAIAVDPFLTGNPVAVHKPEDIRCTHVGITHGHADHFGADTFAIAKANDATIIACFEIATLCGEQGCQAEPGNPGGRIQTDFGWVAFTQAFHSSSYEGQYMGMPCGLVISIGGVRFYHAGDTALFGDMKTIGEWYKPDVAMLPIGDRFTMDAGQAARAAEWVGARTAIPIHYKTFPLIADSAAGFEPAGVEVREMQPGETWDVG